MLTRSTRHATRRFVRTNFFGSFKEKLNKELEQNKELKETLKGIREDKTLSSAAQAARDAASGLQRGMQRAGSSMTAAAEEAGKAAEKASEQAGKAAQRARETVASKTPEGGPADGEAQAQTGADTAGEAGSAGSGSSQAAGGTGGEASPLPLHERLLADVSAVLGSLRAGIQNARRGSSAESASSDSAGGTADSSSTAVVVKEPSFWEKTFNFASDSTFARGFSSFFGAAGDAAGGLGDSILGETEQAEALRELRVQVPDFTVETFLRHDVGQLAPQVLAAYLKGDVETLRRATRDSAYGSLHKSIMEREAQQLVMDPRILHLSDPELEGIRFVGGFPTPVVSFEAHQLNCVRSKMTNAVVEGDEDDIRAVFYLFALQLNEAEDRQPHERWQVTELAVRGMQSVY